MIARPAKALNQRELPNRGLTIATLTLARALEEELGKYLKGLEDNQTDGEKLGVTEVLLLNALVPAMRLRSKAGPVSISELALRIGLRAKRIAHHVRILERRALIKTVLANDRNESQKDGRLKLVQITHEGIEWVTTINAKIRELESDRIGERKSRDLGQSITAALRGILKNRS